MSQTIRVLQVIGSMNRGGAEAMIMNLYRKIDKTKVQFDFVENTDQKAAFDDEIESYGGIIYHCPHFNGKNYIQYKKWWDDFFKKHKDEYKIVHGHIGSSASIYLSVAKKNGCYCIAHSHNTNAKHNIKQILYNFLSYKTRFIADYFFACSKQAGLDRYGKRTVNGNNYSIFNNAIDTTLYAFNKSARFEIRAELGIDDNTTLIGHVGRFNYQKNHEFLIRTFKELYKHDNSYRLVLVGDGVLKEEIIRQISELHLENVVTLTGIRSDVNKIYQAIDILVFPSRFEGLPVTLVEAQSSGLPCVISDHVPVDSILIPELISVMKLNNTEAEWANQISSYKDFSRTDCSKNIQDVGFDITQTAHWLEEFYISNYER